MKKWILTLATCLALLIGYPIAYGIARAHPGIRNILLLCIVLPSWTPFYCGSTPGSVF